MSCSIVLSLRFLSQGLLLNMELVIWLYWTMANELPGSASLHSLQIWGSGYEPLHPDIFMWVLGIRTQVPMLARKNLMHYVTS